MKNLLARTIRHIIAIGCLAAAQNSIKADTIVFDPDAAGNSPKVSFNAWQFGAGNSLDRAALPFTAAHNFQLLFHGQMNSIVTNSGTQVTPAGLNATSAVGAIAAYEITIVGSVNETVTNVNAGPPGRVIYHLATNQTASFVEVYFDAN